MGQTKITMIKTRYVLLPTSQNECKFYIMKSISIIKICWPDQNLCFKNKIILIFKITFLQFYSNV